jgi:hypothetical protein
MNTKIIFSIVMLLAVAAIGATGIITNVPPISAAVSCNPSDDDCDPPGQSGLNNVGQCKHSYNPFGHGKYQGDEFDRSLCKGMING